MEIRGGLLEGTREGRYRLLLISLTSTVSTLNMVKRSLSDGESEFEDTPPPVSPPTTPSKKKTKSTPVKSERKPSTPGKSGLSAQQKRIIIDFMIEATRKAPDFSSLCEKVP